MIIRYENVSQMIAGDTFFNIRCKQMTESIQSPETLEKELRPICMINDN